MSKVKITRALLFKAPSIKHVGKADAKRFMVSIKNKKKVAKYMDENNIRPVDLATIYPPRVTAGMLRSWLVDYRSGKYKFGRSVSVSRA